MGKRLTTLMVLLWLAVTALCGCEGNEEKPPVISHTSAVTESSTTPPPVMEYNSETEEKALVKTKSESREEIVAGILTAFCNKDEDTFNAYAQSCSNSVSYSKLYNKWCEALSEQGLDWKTLSLKPSDFEVIYTDIIWDEEFDTPDEMGVIWDCYYELQPGEKYFQIEIGFNEFDYSTETYSIDYVNAAPTNDFNKKKDDTFSRVNVFSTYYYSSGDISAYITE